MPGRIVVAVVAEYRVYEFWGCEGRFAELLRILETKGESVGGVVWIALLLNLRGEFGYEGAAPADGLAVRFGSWQGGLANLRDEFGSEVHGADRQLAMEFPLGLGLVLVEEAFEEGDGVAEGVSDPRTHQVKLKSNKLTS